MLEKFKIEAARLVAEAAGSAPEEVLPSVEISKVGDLSSRYAFLLTKERKENPAKIASDLSSRMKKSASFDRIEAAGPYINFFFSNKAYSQLLQEILKKQDAFGSGEKKKENVVVEFPSVNPNKPWHIGHLRNALLGDSVARILEFDGFSIQRMDFINDLGLQVAQSLWGYMNVDSKPEGKFDLWLGGQYVEVAKRFEEDPAVAEQVRGIVRSLEEGDNEISKQGRILTERCIEAQYQTAFDLGIFHDVLIFESDIMQAIYDEGVELLKKNDAVILEKEGKNAGCWVVKFNSEEFGDMENPDKILIRSDGTAVYTGKDLIYHLWKFGKLKKDFLYSPFISQPNGKTAYKSGTKGAKKKFGCADKAINVIGVEQKYPQQVVVQLLSKLSFETESRNLKHLSYEHVGLPETKFSGRKGTWVGFTADDLLLEAKDRVYSKIKLELPVDEKKTICHDVGVSAIKFSFLKTSADKRITFKWEDALNMEGDSGPYVQYAYVRTQGILGKSGDPPSAEAMAFNPSEKALIKRLAQMPETVSRCSRELAPHHLAQYLLDVAGDFSSFYSHSPVLPEPDARIRKTRLGITAATGIVLRNSLALLGISTPERM